MAGNGSSEDGVRRALLLIDVQNDFCDGGNLEVPNGTQVVSVINQLRKRHAHKFDLVVLSRDWHPPDHCSFWTNHPGSKPFEVKKLDGVDQVLWNPHCIQNSKGSEFHPDLRVEKTDVVVFKGTNPKVDSYSGFWDNNRGHKTEMEDVLKKSNVKEVYVMGLAYDYCVGFTCLDAAEAGFKVFFVHDACRGIAEASMKDMDEKLKKAGVVYVDSNSLPL